MPDDQQRRDLTKLLIDLDELIADLSESHKYWTINLKGGDGNIRMEVQYHEAVYDLRKGRKGTDHN
jgi:hypothetical protein